MGGCDGGYTLFIKDKKLQYGYNYVTSEYFYVKSVDDVPEGRHKFRFEFEVKGKPDFAQGKGTPGSGQLYIDDKLVGDTEFPFTTPFALGLGAAVAVGSDPGSPTIPDYDPPFEFKGKIYTVVVDVSGDLIKDDEAALKAVMARQ